MLQHGWEWMRAGLTEQLRLPPLLRRGLKLLSGSGSLSQEPGLESIVAIRVPSIVPKPQQEIA